MTKVTVGRVVHFYSEAVANRPGVNPGYGHNGQGAGPYPAMVTQVFTDSDGNVTYANMKVFPPFAPPFDEGSVSEGGEKAAGRYWVWPPREENATAEPRAEPVAHVLSEEQIAHMKDRFLSWRLPENFSPDGGIHFDADAAKKLDPRNLRYEPNGTNLFDATQAHAMVRHMIEGLPDATV